MERTIKITIYSINHIDFGNIKIKINADALNIKEEGLQI